MSFASSGTAFDAERHGAPRALLGKSGWAVVLIVWAAYALYQSLAYGGVAIERMSSDDAMRLVEVRDLLNGQGWFDLMQNRLNPPTGVLMHWSRLIDLPIAALLRLAETVLPAETALRVVLIVWPSMLMLAAMLACAACASAVAGPLAGALSAPLFLLSPALLIPFGAGAIDHHNAQMALMLTMLAGVMRIAGPGAAAAGIMAGAAAAGMTAIGMETAPHVVAGAGFVALRWAIEGEPAARGARAFGVSFGLSTAAVAVATVPPWTWGAPVCDAIGLGHIAAAMAGGFGLAIATLFAKGGAMVRFVALGGVGIAGAAAIGLTAPNCLTTPYGELPERLKTAWLDHVQEAHSFVASARSEPTAAFAIGAALIGAIAASFFVLTKSQGETRWRVAAAASLLVAACAVTLWQIRGTSLAFAAAATLLPAAIVLIAQGRGWARFVLAAGALNPATLAVLGLGTAGLVGAAPLEDRGEFGGVCPVADYRALARVAPAGLALNSIYSGPFLLAHTPLSAVAAPYHRDVDGLTASVDAFRGSEAEAHRIARARSAAYVVACATDGDAKAAAEGDPSSFAGKLFSPTPPAWLERIDLGPDAKVMAWRVLPGS